MKALAIVFLLAFSSASMFGDVTGSYFVSDPEAGPGNAGVIYIAPDDSPCIDVRISPVDSSNKPLLLSSFGRQSNLPVPACPGKPIVFATIPGLHGYHVVDPEDPSSGIDQVVNVQTGDHLLNDDLGSGKADVMRTLASGPGEFVTPAEVPSDQGVIALAKNGYPYTLSPLYVVYQCRDDSVPCQNWEGWAARPEIGRYAEFCNSYTTEQWTATLTVPLAVRADKTVYVGVYDDLPDLYHGQVVSGTLVSLFQDDQLPVCKSSQQ